MSLGVFPPPALKRGDTVGIVAMASRVKPEAVHRAIDLLNQWGLEVIVGESVFSSHFNYSAPDEVRQRDLQSMLDNPRVKAIFSARGGYGSSRIVDDLNFYLFQKSPKWIVGFSDITALHGTLQRLGYQSIHGPMPSTFFQDTYSTTTLKHLLWGESFNYTWEMEDLPIRTGSIKAPLVGGNLCLLAHSLGSNSDFSFDQKILFLEDVGEAHYALDRYMVQLRRAGKLQNLAGLILGQFSDMKDPASNFGKTAEDIVFSHVAKFNFPVVCNFPAGHTKQNYALPLGRLVQLDITPTQATMRG